MSDGGTGIGDFVSSVIGVSLAFVWIFSAPIGMIYWAIEEDLVNVVLSLMIPLYGPVTMLFDLMA